jgi:prolyl-tRNA synthetase
MQMKSLVYVVESQPHLLLLRGDHQLNETKLARVLRTDVFRPAEPREIREAFGADAGSLGPVDVTGMRILADTALAGRRNMVCGANRDDYHLKNVTPGEDFQTEFHDIRLVEAGDACPHCGQPLAVSKALEVGHIFKLGYKYSRSMGARVLGHDGAEIPIIMGSYGIGLERIMVAAVELFYDANGIVWPRSIAPFQAVITVLRTDDPEQMTAAEGFYRTLTERGIDCLLDDREERPGVKFKDAELIGVPVRLTVGRKLSQGKVELLSRKDLTVKEAPVENAIQEVVDLLDRYPL